MRHTGFVVSIIVAVTGLGCGDGDAQADRRAIEAGLQQLEEAFTAGDADAVVSLFSQDCITLPPNEAARVGKDAVREWHEAIFQQFSGVADLTSGEVVIRDDLAYLLGAYTMQLTSSEGAEIVDNGKFIMIWRRQSEGSWMIARNIWNSDNPTTGL